MKNTKNMTKIMGGATLATLTLLTTAVNAHAATAPFPTSGAETLKNCQMFDTPVYENDASATKKVFYSTDKNEAKTITKDRFDSYKGVAFYASSKSGDGLTPVHKVFNKISHDYLYIKEGADLTKALGNVSVYQDLGIIFYASSTPNDCNEAVGRAVKKNVHTYTTSLKIHKENLANGWMGEGVQFYVNSRPEAYSQQLYTDFTPAITAYNNETDAQKKLADYQIAITPTATWVGNNSDNDRLKNVINKAKALGQTPQVTLYGIPERDCGSFSAGGLNDEQAYNSWIDGVSAIIGDTPAIVIVEPDAVSFCSWAENDPKRIARQDMLKHVGETFAKNNKNSATYLHMGSGQLTQWGAYNAIKNIDFDNYTGFAMGVSSLGGTEREESWGEDFVKTLNSYGIVNKHYVVDTSRNGVDKPANIEGAAFLSCDNPNAALGHRPSIKTTADHDDAWLWVKHPGVSDGECNIGGKPSGVWDGDYALSLMNNAIRVNSISIINPQ